MEKEVRKFVGAVLDRSTSIGVRGEITRDYLKHLGFSDVEVIGCPSMFYFGKYIPKPNRKFSITENSKTALTFSPYLHHLNEFLSDLLMLNEEIEYFIQDIDSMLMWKNQNLTKDDHNQGGIPDYLEHKLFAKEKARVHFDSASWIQDLSRFESVIGTRIHGTIAAILAGVPSLLLAHDSRTIELARYFDIPHLNLEKRESSIDSVREFELSWNVNLMISGHLERYERFAKFLAANSLELNNELDLSNFEGINPAKFTLSQDNLKKYSELNPKVSIDIIRYLWKQKVQPELRNMSIWKIN
jgi:polysaccharide pyruvyl transferase WcaK-like protein